MKTKSTKRALLCSLLSLAVCISMLVGTTFAWFTDSVTSTNNIIKSGNLDVSLEWMEGKLDPTDKDSTDWKDASQGAIFNYSLWEPGYTCVRHVKIENEGSLALKYKVAIEATGEVSKLAEVIDVYYIDPATGPVSDRATFSDANKLGTLKEVLAGMSSTAAGELLAGDNDTITLALKMQESAGNEYEDLAIGSSFAVKLFATQLAAESDSFGNDYDVFADYDGEISNPSSFAAALEKGGSYKFVGDVTVPAGILPVVPEGVTVVLDLAGNDLSAENVETEYALNNLGKLTIWDSTAIASTYSLRSTPAATINARGIYNGYDKDGNYVSDAEITVLNGTINAKGTNGGAAIYNYGKVTIESGTFTSAGGYALNNQPGAEMIIKNASVTGGVYNCGDLTIENSTVYQHISGRHAVYNWSANLVINSGSFDSISGNELILADGQGASVTINGGTFDKTAKSWLFGAATGKNITFDIYGGTFNGYVNMPEGTVDTVRPYGDPIVIYGGSFNFDPTTWVADGHKVVKNTDGTWTVEREYINVAPAGDDKEANGNALADVINNTTAGSYIALGAGEYKMPSVAGDKEVTIVGTKDTVIDVTLGAYMDGSTVAFEGVTIKGSRGKANGNGSDDAALYTPNVTYTDCTFDGPFAVGRDGAKFIRCTFTNLGNDYVWNMSNDTVFEGCTFNTDGKALLLYAHGSNAGDEMTTVVVKNCVFNATKKAYAGAVSNLPCAAIEIHNYGCGFNLTTSGNTYDSNFSGEWRIKTYETGNALYTITVNGAEYTTTALDGKLMTVTGGVASFN